MARQALEGIKVADFTVSAAGPIIGAWFGDYGAQVVHIESATHPDMLRLAPPFKDNIAGLNRSAYSANYNRSKYGLALNLNLPQAREIAKKIVTWADVVVESLGLGVMQRWELGYEQLVRIKPDIIMISTTQQGQTGPWAAQRGYGLQAVAASGFSYITGWPDREPAQPYGAYTDFIAPRFTTFTLLAALDYHRRMGKGCYIDLSQIECAIQFLAPVVLDYSVNKREITRNGNRCSYAVPHEAYPCLSKDRWCVIAVFTHEEWQAFCHVIGDPEWTKGPKFASLLGRKRHEDELDKLVAQWTVNFAAEEVMSKMQEVGVAAGVVKSNKDVFEDPQLQHRGHFVTLKHPEIGLHCYDSTGFSLSKTPGKPRMHAPCLGEQSEYFCTKVLGISDEEFIKLLAEGVFE